MTPELADRILERISEGESLRAICSEPDMPHYTAMNRWIEQDVLGLSDRYARARRLGLDWIAEDAIRIADDVSEDANSRRVRIDARRWFLSKLRPDKYGDRLELSGQVNLTHSIADILRQREAAITTVAESSMQLLNTSVAATVQPLGVAGGSTEPIMVTSEPITDAE